MGRRVWCVQTAGSCLKCTAVMVRWGSALDAALHLLLCAACVSRRSGESALRYAEKALADLRSVPSAAEAFGAAILQAMPALAQVGGCWPDTPAELPGRHAGVSMLPHCTRWPPAAAQGVQPQPLGP